VFELHTLLINQNRKGTSKGFYVNIGFETRILNNNFGNFIENPTQTGVENKDRKGNK